MDHVSESLSHLAIVCPFFNAKDFVDQRIPDFRELAANGVQLIFVDDCSTDGGADILSRELGSSHSFQVVELDSNSGAGVARNAGLEYVTRPYVLFFDIDDRIDVATLGRAVSLARKSRSEVQISRYLTELDNGNSRASLAGNDKDILAEAEARFSGSCFDIRAYPRILRLTNYPWNKIISTDFARRVGFRFGATRVQNDVLAHWSALLPAQYITVFPESYTTHLVSRGRNQITNDFGLNRLELFDALEEVEEQLLNALRFRSLALNEYMAFKTELISWARDRMSPRFLTVFEDRLARHVHRTQVSDLLIFSKFDSRLAARYSGKIIQRI